VSRLEDLQISLRIVLLGHTDEKTVIIKFTCFDVYLEPCKGSHHLLTFHHAPQSAMFHFQGKMTTLHVYIDCGQNWNNIYICH
jgi:hypothetical protein